MLLRIGFSHWALTVAALCLVSCGGGGSGGGGTGMVPIHSTPPAHKKKFGDYIKHIVVVIQENRSFDDLFATYPGADGATEGLMKTTGGDVEVPLKKFNLNTYCDPGHGYKGFLKSYDGGMMDGFALSGNKCSGDHTEPYQYVDPNQIKPYWTIAKQYVLGDQMFQTQGSGSFTAHQDLIAGATLINPKQTESLVDYPASAPWGCDAPPGTRTDLLDYFDSKIHYKYRGGPFPCVTYATLRDLLDAKSLSWKYYSPPVKNNTGAIWNAFDAIKAVRYGPEWGTNVTDSNKKIFSDIRNGKLPAVSWIIPDRGTSDHPMSPRDLGPEWVATIVNAIGESSYWNTSAIVIVWDDWGGYYDNAKPPFFDHWGGLGFRVPMLVVSPYAQIGTPSQSYISHTQYEFGSILKFIEQTFELGSLGTTDARANSISDCFNFKQQPRKFSQIPSDRSRSFFEHQPPSYLPVDTE
jgi:phospholipase C